MASFVGEKFAGLAYVLGSICTLIALLIAPSVWRRIGGYKFLLLIALLDALSFLVLALTQSAVWAVIAFTLGFCLNILVVFSLDELLKISSKDSATGRIRGIYLLFSNLAWVLAQIVSGTILGGYSFSAIYMIGFCFMAIFFLICFIRLRKIPDPKYDQKSPARYLRDFFRNKNLSRAYGMNMTLQFFYSWMVIYTPIYLSAHLGFSWSELGIIFAIMLLPFCIVPFPLGRYADKIGERNLLMLSFAIASISTLSLFFISSREIFLWAFILFMTRVGAAGIEVMCDVYFFKHIRSENDEYVGVYRSATPIAYIVGPMAAFVAFLYMPSFNFLYVILGAIMLGGTYIASTIKKGDI